MTARILTLFLFLLPWMGSEAAAQLRLETLLGDIEQHPRVRAARAEADLYHGRKLQAWSPDAPTLTYHEEEITTGGTLGTGALREWQLSQGIDIPLLTGVRGSSDAHLERAAELRMDVVKREVRADIISSYARWYASAAQLDIQEQNATLAAEFARKAQLRLEQGESGALEASRARAEAAAARVSLSRARSSARDAAAALYEASGGSAAAGTAVSALPADTLFPRRLDAIRERIRGIDHVAQLPESSPMLTALRETRDASRANASWRWMEFLPRFELSYIRQDFADIGRHWGAELTASLPLWFLLDTRGSIEEHRAAQRIAEEDYTLTKLQLDTKLQRSVMELRAALDDYDAYADELLAEAAAISATAESGYANGEIGYMEYIAARRTANSITMEYYDSLATLYAAVAQYELYNNEHIVE